MVFLNILLNIIAPIFLMMGLGFVLNKFHPLDIPTLSKITFYIFTPAILFLLIFDSPLDAGDFFRLTLIAFLQQGILFGIGWLIFSWRPFQQKRIVMTFGGMQYNAGNFGIPLLLLVLGEGATSVSAVTMMVHSMLLFTVGLMVIDPETTNLWQGLNRLVRLPVLHAIWLGFLFRWLGFEFPPAMDVPIRAVSAGYVSIALLTLGAELSRVRIVDSNVVALLPVIMRLALSPLIAVGLVMLLPVDEVLAQALIIVSGTPTAVNVYLLASEFKRDADLASLIIFWTTLLSAFTLPVLLLLLGLGG